MALCRKRDRINVMLGRGMSFFTNFFIKLNGRFQKRPVFDGDTFGFYLAVEIRTMVDLYFIESGEGAFHTAADHDIFGLDVRFNPPFFTDC
jgi:hypothetical protein